MAGEFDKAYNGEFDDGTGQVPIVPEVQTGNSSPRATKRWHDPAPLNWHGKPPEWSRKNAEVINGVMQGRTNNRGTITLSVSQAGGAVTATPIVDPRIGIDSVLAFMPTNLNASTVTGLYVTSLSTGRCVLNHPSQDSTAAIFDYVVFS